MNTPGERDLWGGGLRSILNPEASYSELSHAHAASERVSAGALARSACLKYNDRFRLAVED